MLIENLCASIYRSVDIYCFKDRVMMRKFRFEEKVFVASNEHAAEVIGKHGRKIKRIAKDTQTFIKCPCPTHPPIFEIYGHRKHLITRAKRDIQRFADHFDKMKNKKRQIRLDAGEKIETIWFEKADVACVIGKRGRQIKKIMFQSQAKVISPDTNKNSIFIIIGLNESVKVCILWMKLTALCSSGNNYLNLKEISIISNFLLEKSSELDFYTEHIREIINVRILKERFNLIRFKSTVHYVNNDFPPQSLYRCWNCKLNSRKIARCVCCGHVISCDKCIAILYVDVYLKCQNSYCQQKIENFLIENFSFY